VSEERSEYLTEDERAILARLLEVFTWGQLLQLAEKMSEVRENRFGGVEVVVERHQLRFKRILSDSGGVVAWSEERKI
jgi:hypothetical protein